MYCTLCRIKVNESDELEHVNNKTPFSKKTVYAIITYLAKSAKPPIDVAPAGQPFKYICKACYNDILTYDEYMLKLLEIQKRILSSLRNPNEDIPPLEEFADIDAKIEISVQNNFESSDDCDNAEENKESFTRHDAKVGSNVDDSDDFKNSQDAESKSELNESIDASISSIRRYKVPAKCKRCDKIFKNKSQLRRHMSVVHKPSKKIWKCEVCGIITKDEEYLELHKNIHEGKSDLECRFCNKRYARKINVIRHMQKHWDKKKFQCERCGLMFSEIPIYYNHKLQHEAEEDPLICNVCNQSFKTRRTYRRHLWVHREDRPRFSCEICGKTFVEKYTLKVHLKCHSDKEEERGRGRRKIINELKQQQKAFECIICGNQFSSQDLCDEHMKAQHDVILRAENIFI
ncbi:serendipity locus protein delta-like [Rhagoletis pomonella]|uniref:serendipity locus protein delta-like n=1 Tax=Rhagoletis pomonella TaxID=28610 RepID=UPI00177C8AE2|nr:serendipity locus protein delta-like [Rhagoletis pomonella]